MATCVIADSTEVAFGGKSPLGFTAVAAFFCPTFKFTGAADFVSIQIFAMYGMGKFY